MELKLAFHLRDVSSGEDVLGEWKQVVLSLPDEVVARARDVPMLQREFDSLSPGDVGYPEALAALLAARDGIDDICAAAGITVGRFIQDPIIGYLR